MLVFLAPFPTIVVSDEFNNNVRRVIYSVRWRKVLLAKNEDQQTAGKQVETDGNWIA